MGEQPNFCYYEFCNASFKNKYNLKRHINTKHLGIRRFECEVCGKKLASKQNLVEHRFIHSNEKPFKCSYFGCNKSYRQSSQLCIHKRTHRSKDSPEVQDESRAKKYRNREKLKGMVLPELSVERSNSQLGCKISVVNVLLDDLKNNN